MFTPVRRVRRLEKTVRTFRGSNQVKSPLFAKSIREIQIFVVHDARPTLAVSTVRYFQLKMVFGLFGRTQNGNMN